MFSDANISNSNAYCSQASFSGKWMLLSLAINFLCQEPSCWKHEVIRRYIHWGQQEVQLQQTLKPDLGKFKLEIDCKIQEDFREREIKGDRELGKEIKEKMDVNSGPEGCLELKRRQEKSCISGI